MTDAAALPPLPRRRRIRRVLVGPKEIAGFYRNLTRGFQQLGIPVDFYTEMTHPFGYGGETIAPWPLRLRMRLLHRLVRERPTGLEGRVVRWLVERLPFVWLAWALVRYDVFIMGFGESLLPGNRDLPILRAFGKTVISVLAHGSEARPPYMDGAHQNEQGHLKPLESYPVIAAQNRALVAFHQRHASVVVGAPYSTTHFAERPLVNCFALGGPFWEPDDAAEEDPAEARHGAPGGRRRVRILHSPSHRAAKGTPVIEEAIRSLQRRGYDIEFVVVAGRPHREVIREIKRCDFIVDQIYSDTPLAGFPTEAAWFGRPALVAGYRLEELRQLVPPDMWPPSKTCSPDRVEAAIEEMIVDVEERNRLGAEAQAFVRTQWSARAVAARYAQLARGEAPPDWFIDPRSVVYLEGCAQRLEITAALVQLLVQRYGVAALQLAGRPELESALLSFFMPGERLLAHYDVVRW